MKDLLVVLDFDGTFTDVDLEGAPFEKAYARELSGLIGRDASTFWDDAVDALQKKPDAGWQVGGKVVAPADSDPYIRATCVGFEICDRLGLLPNLKIRGDVLQVLFAYCYHVTRNVPRPDAAETIRRLAALDVPLYFVTNSDPSLVKAKIRDLGFADLPVVGDAKKYVIGDLTPSDPRFEAVRDVTVPGLGRPMLAKRPRYFRALDELWKTTGLGPDRTIVCGDVFELDLLLPLAVGTMGHLLLRDRPRPYERAALDGFRNANASTTLAAFADRVEALARR